MESTAVKLAFAKSVTAVAPSPSLISTLVFMFPFRINCSVLLTSRIFVRAELEREGDKDQTDGRFRAGLSGMLYQLLIRANRNSARGGGNRHSRILRPVQRQS